MIVDATVDFELDGRPVLGRRVLAWDVGRLVTQDLDWDHLPTLGWAVDGRDGRAVLHEERAGRLIAVDVVRGRELGILKPGSDRLVEHRSPTIAECRSVRRLSASHFEADCRLEDGREVVVLGESESGELPDVGFAGRTTSAASRFDLVEQLSARR